MINQFHTKRLVMNGFAEKHKRLPNKNEWKIIQKCIIQTYQDLAEDMQRKLQQVMEN